MTHQVAAADKNTDGLPNAQIHQLLSNDRRALALSILQTDGPLAPGELADCLARHEYGPDFDADERKRVYVSLHQAHLPKLKDTGVVEETGEHTSTLMLTERARPVLWHLNNGYERSGAGKLRAVMEKVL